MYLGVNLILNYNVLFEKQKIYKNRNNEYLAKLGVSMAQHTKINSKILLFTQQFCTGAAFSSEYSADENIYTRTFSDDKVANSEFFDHAIWHFLGDLKFGMR